MPCVNERFWNKVEKTGDCWLWTAGCTPKGYGQFRLGGRQVYAHRYSYEEHHGPVPEGLQIDHLCRNRACVNPVHLEAVTCGQDLRRGDGWPAKNAAKTHCINGHPFDEENTYRYKEWRQCRKCRTESVRRLRSKERAS